MSELIGVVLAIGVGLFGTCAGFDRERSFYPVLLIVVASYYVLFAMCGNAPAAAVPEALAMVLFVAAAVAGYRQTEWLVVAALVLHGCFDAVHGMLIDNPGVPAWWPAFCLCFDLAVALYLVGKLVARDPVDAAAAGEGAE